MFGGNLYTGHKIKNFFLADEIRSFRHVAPRDSILLCGVYCRITVAYLRRTRLIPWCPLRISSQWSHRWPCPPPPSRQVALTSIAMTL